jgi:hypothetical protein
MYSLCSAMYQYNINSHFAKVLLLKIFTYFNLFQTDTTAFIFRVFSIMLTVCSHNQLHLLLPLISG